MPFGGSRTIMSHPPCHTEYLGSWIDRFLSSQCIKKANLYTLEPFGNWSWIWGWLISHITNRSPLYPEKKRTRIYLPETWLVVYFNLYIYITKDPYKFWQTESIDHNKAWGMNQGFRPYSCSPCKPQAWKVELTYVAGFPLKMNDFGDAGSP